MANEVKTSAIARVDELPEWAKDVVTPYVDRTQFNLLLPAIPVNASLAYGHQPKLSLTKIDPNPSNGEVYKVGSKKEGNGWVDTFALAKPALDKIGTSAGIQFQTQRLDDGRNRRLAGFKCLSAMKNESGQVIVKTYQKWINMDDVEDESRAQRKKNRKAGQTDEQLETELQREMSQYQKHLAARCETGAILRAIRGQLGIRSQWTANELAKPFVMMRIDFQPDASDPDVKRFLLEQGSKATAVLFSQPLPAPERPADETRAHVVHDDDDEVPAGGPGEPLEQTDLPLHEESGSSGDPLEKLIAACAALGLSSPERNALMIKHHGDIVAALHELDNRASKASQ